MPNFCAVVGCGSRGNRDLNSFFRIPAIPTRGSPHIVKLKTERRLKWIAALKRTDLTETKLKYAKICDKHFITGRPAELQDVNHPDWVPSLLMGYKTKDSLASPTIIDRYNRLKIRNEADGNIQGASSSMDVDLSDSVDFHEGGTNVETQTELKGENAETQTERKGENAETQTELRLEDIDNMSDVINSQTVEICNLKQKMNFYVVTEDSFKDEKKTRFYTGLANFQILIMVYNLIASDLPETSRSALTKFQQLILTFQRLRLNLSLTDLSYRYGVSISTVSKAFNTCIYIMWKKLKWFIVWPERENLWKTMPSIFLDAFGKKVSVIIDCFEVKTEKPSNLLSSAQVWSNYKQHHTTKFLIGICPQGSISFISSGWGGKASDKEIALNCGILDNLLPGDIILTDRGFLISDAVELYCAEVKMPCFIKGKKQLQPYEVESNRKISHVRIHVERVIGSLRQKYQILHSILPIHMLQAQTFEDAPALINQIVIVCCALVNLCPTVVPLD